MFAPHPRAAKVTAAAAKLLNDAAVKVGAPPNVIQSLENPTVALVNAVMRHPTIHFILATGGAGMVKACYSSGKPTIGVGAGNTPAVIDELADIPQAVSSILMSKVFDLGVICASEQSIIVVESKLDELKTELRKRGACVLSDPAAVAKLQACMFPPNVNDPHLIAVNGKVVGQRATTIAELAGITLDPPNATVIVADKSGQPFDVSDSFSGEKLSPVLSLYAARDYREAFAIASSLVSTYGAGHTSLYFTDSNKRDRIREFELAMPTGRVLIDVPASFGAIGDLYNFRLEPAMQLACGTWGGNSFSGNVGPLNLLNIATGVERRENMEWMKIPPAVFYKSHILGEALKDLRIRKSRKALIVTDHMMVTLGIAEKVVDALKKVGVESDIFSGVLPDPTTACIEEGVRAAQQFQPDTIVGLGGGSPIDAAKIIRMMYEHPEVKFSSLYTRFADIRKRVFEFPLLGKKVHTVVAIPTTSGTGAEVTPFAVITDAHTGKKYPIASYRLTPEMAICDGSLAVGMPKTLAAHTGIDALTHAIESYVSVMATVMTKPYSAESAGILLRGLEASVNKPTPELREDIHTASTMAGLAFGNAFLGVCHSMAHALGSTFHISHGLANAYCLQAVMRFNGTDCPTRRSAFSQYKHYHAKDDYAQLAVLCGLAAPDLPIDEKFEKLVVAVQQLKQRVGVAHSIRAGEPHISEDVFTRAIPQMAEAAFDDQCTGCNPRYPLIKELEELFIDVFNGDTATKHLWEQQPPQV